MFGPVDSAYVWSFSHSEEGDIAETSVEQYSLCLRVQHYNKAVENDQCRDSSRVEAGRYCPACLGRNENAGGEENVDVDGSLRG